MTRDDDEQAWLAAASTRLREIGMAEEAEVLEELSRAERRALGRRLRNLHGHLLRLAYAEKHDLRLYKRGWMALAWIARVEIADMLKESPSLKAQVPRLHRREYRLARREAGAAMDRSMPAKALDARFWPTASAPPPKRR